MTSNKIRSKCLILDLFLLNCYFIQDVTLYPDIVRIPWKRRLTFYLLSNIINNQFSLSQG